MINIRLPRRLSGKESACNAGDLSSVPGLGRSPGGGNGNPHHYSYLENPMDRGAWRATVHGVTENWTWLSDRSAQHTELICWELWWIKHRAFKNRWQSKQAHGNPKDALKRNTGDKKHCNSNVECIDGLFIKWDMAEERISEFEDISIDTSKTEKQREQGPKEKVRTEYSRTMEQC